MTVEDVLAHIERRFRECADNTMQQGAERFFKEPVRPRGIRSGDLKKIESEVYALVKRWTAAERETLCEALWLTGELEKGAIVCHIHRKFHGQFGARDFQLFAQWIDRHVTNWSHTDGVASWLLAGAIANDPSLIAKLPAWTKSKNRWKRRASAVSLLQEAKKGRHLEAIFDIANRLHQDEDDMVRKGIGWLLKEAYPKHPAKVVTFLTSLPFSRVTIRYAAEKMTPRDKAAVMRRD